jgi:tetratricopeptide (TPR) repeat protein
MSRVSRFKKSNVSQRDAAGVPPPVPQAQARPTAIGRAVTVIGRLGALLPALAVGLTAVLALRRLSDADTWWHLAAGRWIAEHRAIPRTDTLSFTVPDHPWINLQWLFDLSVYALFRAGGPDLLAAAGAAVYALGTALLLKNLRVSLGPVAATILALSYVTIAQERFVIRPEMFSFLFLQIVLWLYLTAGPGRARRLWLLPAVMLLWVNTHALFVVGVFVIGCHMAASVAARLPLLPRVWREAAARVPMRTVLLSGGLAVLLILVNPYGLDGALFPLKLMTHIGGESAFLFIGELLRPFSPYYVTYAVRTYQVFFFFACGVVALAGVMTLWPTDRRRRHAVSEGGGRKRRRGKRDVGSPDRAASGVTADGGNAGLDLANLAAFVGLAYLSTLARRNMALFALGAAPIVARCLAMLGPRLQRRWSAHRELGKAAMVLVLLPAMIVAAWLVASNRFYWWNGQLFEFGTGILEASAPIKASAFVKEQSFPPPLYNDWTSGGYLTWDQPVEGGVYIDSRGEVYDDQFYSDYLARLKQPARWQDEADHLGFQTVILLHVWSAHRPLLNWLLKDQRWAMVYFDESAAVFLRRAGNEALIETAIGAFESSRARTERALLDRAGSWQWPAGKARGLVGYASVLDAMGKGSEAVPFYARALEIGAPRNLEVGAALRLVQYHIARGERDLARAYLDRAAGADPGNPGIARLRSQIGQ